MVLVVKNATSMKGGLNTLQLYDKLESNFRALESIGMTADKYTAMLFSLVVSCMPEEHVKSLDTKGEKVKCTLVQAMKVQRRRRGIALLFL